MRIATLGEDNMHDAVLRGLAKRWCPDAEVETGAFRHHGKGTRRRQLYAECDRLMRRGKCDCAAILLDADNDKWDHKVRNERSKLPPEYVDLTAIGAPERNIECWLVADLADFCATTGADRQQIEQAKRDDPKGQVGAALKSAAGDRKHVNEYVTRFVKSAPIAKWCDMSCFEGFRTECANVAQRFQCDRIPNERDSKTRRASGRTAP